MAFLWNVVNISYVFRVAYDADSSLDLKWLDEIGGEKSIIKARRWRIKA